MQVVILCGGKGTRLRELTEEIPKPLVEVGNRPILHHLMGLYAFYGYKDFILCLGYKGDKVKEYFKGKESGWKIDFADTGEDSNKAERLMKVKDRIKGRFLLSYGDDLCDADINRLIEFHKKSGKMVTLTAVRLESPFGIVDINEKSEVTAFREKPKLDKFMNGGFYVVEKEILGRIKPGQDLEKDTMAELAKEGKVGAFKHEGFWKSMNTLKDSIELNEMFRKGETPWIK